MTVAEVCRALEEIAPFSLAEPWDNVGLLLGDLKRPVSRVMVALDATMEIVGEAAEKEVDLLITHHPVIFQPLKRIAGDSVVAGLLRRDLPVICAHTNLDIAGGGVNDALAERLGLTGITGLSQTAEQPFFKLAVMVPKADADKLYHALSDAGAGRLGNYSHCGFLAGGEGRFLPWSGATPHIGRVGAIESVEEIRLEMLVAPDRLDEVLRALREAHPYEEPAFDLVHNYACKERSHLGRIGKLPAPLAPEEFARLVKQRLGVGGLVFVPGEQPVETVAVCGGSGGEFLYEAKARGAQALVTGECKHHLLLEARHMGFTLVQAGHYATEAVVLAPLAAMLADRLPGLWVEVAGDDRDPALYL